METNKQGSLVLYKNEDGNICEDTDIVLFIHICLKRQIPHKLFTYKGLIKNTRTRSGT